MTLRGDALVVRETAIRIRPMLAGLDPSIQGAVIGDLLATWLAGHHVHGDIDATREMREVQLQVLCRLVRELTDLNAKMLGTTPSDPQP